MMSHHVCMTALCAFFMVCSTNAAAEKTREGRASLGGFITDGNTDKSAFVFDAIAKATYDANRYTVGGDIRYANDQGIVTENNHQAFAEYDRFLNTKLFVGSRANYESDKIAALDYRFKLGPYVGYQFHKSDQLNLSTRGGLDYIATQFATGDKEDNIAASWGLDYDQRFFNKAVQVFYKHDISLPIDDTSAFLYEGQTGIRFPIAKVLTGSLQVDFDWNNAPAAGVREADTMYSMRIGYEF